MNVESFIQPFNDNTQLFKAIYIYSKLNHLTQNEIIECLFENTNKKLTPAEYMLFKNKLCLCM